MTNRYCNLVGTDKIKDSYTHISSGFDAVQADRDSMPANMARQAIINPNFDVWQRGTTFNNPNNTYGPDRYKITNVVDINIKILRSTDVPNISSKYSLRAEVMTATSGTNAVTDITQYVEDYNLFAGKQVTISGFVKCDSSASVTPITDDGVATNIGTTITSTTWVPFSINATVSASATRLAIVMRFNRSGLAVGVGLNITQLQLCVGSQALPFQPKSYAEELTLCQRYGEPIGAGVFGQAIGATDAKMYGSFKTQKRIAPTLTLLSSTPGLEEIGVADRTASGGTLTSISGNTSGFTVFLGGFSGLTNGNRIGSRANFAFADAEL